MLFEKAVLVIHGLGGGTWENEFLVNYLELSGRFKVFSFTLPGHEHEVVKKVKYNDWIESSEKELETLIKKYKSVYVVGHSMGGIIATHLAAKYKQVTKLVLIAPAFEYGSFSQNKKDIKRYIFKRTTYKKSYREEIYQDLIYKLFRVPFFTLLEFRELAKNYRDKIKEVKCPVLILHGDEDELVPLTSSQYVFDTVSSENKHLTIIKNVKHRVFISNKKEKVSKFIYNFLRGGFRWIIKKKSEL